VPLKARPPARRLPNWKTPQNVGHAPAPRMPAAPLTARQLTVARAIATGKSNREVASELYISVKTVESHVGQILTRLGVDSRGEIERALLREGAGARVR